MYILLLYNALIIQNNFFMRLKLSDMCEKICVVPWSTLIFCESLNLAQWEFSLFDSAQSGSLSLDRFFTGSWDLHGWPCGLPIEDRNSTQAGYSGQACSSFTIATVSGCVTIWHLSYVGTTYNVANTSADFKFNLFPIIILTSEIHPSIRLNTTKYIILGLFITFVQYHWSIFS